MRPLSEILHTVLVDRGGAPLHFVLAHAAFWIDGTAEALRWLSVVFALGAVPLCFDLGRRLGGVGAGIVAAAVAASSTALAVYGSFGRMYALLVFVAALFADLLVRALQVRTTGAVAAAAAAAWLLPATHPYGAIPAGVALGALVAMWRRRPLWALAAVALAALAVLPFLLADLRLADRAAIGGGGERSLASAGDAWSQLVAAASAFAGGDGLPLVFFTVLAVVGLAVLVRREPAVAALAASTAIPPVLFLLIRTDTAPDLSPRHLFYGLPLWAAAIGVGSTSVFRRMPAAVAIVALVAVVSPASALRDPRELGFASAPVNDAPAIEAHENDVLLPYSAVFLGALPEVRRAVALPHGRGDDILRTLEHVDEPIGSVYLAVPTHPWTVRRLAGPFDKAAALSAALKAVAEYRQTPALQGWRGWIEPGLREALATLARRGRRTSHARGAAARGARLRGIAAPAAGRADSRRPLRAWEAAAPILRA